MSSSSQFEPQPSRPGTPRLAPAHSVQRATTGLPSLPSTHSVERPALDLPVVEMPAARSPQPRLPDVIPRPVPVALGATPASLPVQRAAEPVAAERLPDPASDPVSDPVSAPVSEASRHVSAGRRRDDGNPRFGAAATFVDRGDLAGHRPGRKPGASRRRAAAVRALGAVGVVDALGAADAIGAYWPVAEADAAGAARPTRADGAAGAAGARSPDDRPTGYGLGATASGPRDGADLASAPSTEPQAVQPSPAVRPLPTSAAGSHTPVSVQTSTSQGPRKPAEPRASATPPVAIQRSMSTFTAPDLPDPPQPTLLWPPQPEPRSAQPTPEFRALPTTVAGTSEPFVAPAAPASAPHVQRAVPAAFPAVTAPLDRPSISRSPQAASGPAGPLLATEVSSRSGPNVQRHEVSAAPVAQATWFAAQSTPESAALPAWAETPDVSPARSEASLQRSVGTAPSQAPRAEGLRMMPLQQMFGVDSQTPAPSPVEHSPRIDGNAVSVQTWPAPTLVQRQEEPGPVPEPPAADAGPPPAAGPAAGAAAAPAAAPGGAASKSKPTAAELDELAKRLYEPLSARLRTELWLDRERSGRSMTR